MARDPGLWPSVSAKASEKRAKGMDPWVPRWRSGQRRDEVATRGNMMSEAHENHAPGFGSDQRVYSIGHPMRSGRGRPNGGNLSIRKARSLPLIGPKARADPGPSVVPACTAPVRAREINGERIDGPKKRFCGAQLASRGLPEVRCSTTLPAWRSHGGGGRAYEGAGGAALG